MRHIIRAFALFGIPYVAGLVFATCRDSGVTSQWLYAVPLLAGVIHGAFIWYFDEKARHV